ncbi:unnamed protein product, partial [marine sediment metagenome]
MARQWQQDEQDAARGVGGFREDMDLRRLEMRNPALARSGREAAGGERTRSLRGFTVGSQGGPKYRAYRRHNFRDLPQIQLLSPEEQFAIEVVAQVLPFKTNS